MSAEETSPPPPPSMFPTSLLQLQYAQNWIALGAHIVTITTMGLLLWATHRGWSIVRIKQFSPGLLLFFCANITFSALGLPYQLYRIIHWTSPDLIDPTASNMGNPYRAKILFWLSGPEFVYYGAIPATVLLLTVERCLTLKLPLHWMTRRFSAFAVTAFLAIVLFNLIGHLLELPLDLSKDSICQTGSCITDSGRLYFQIGSKCVLSCADTIISILFLALLHGSGNAKKLKNRVILYTLVIEFLLGIIPTFVMVVINKFTDLSIGAPNSGEKGELMVTLCALDAAACGFLYWALLFRWKSGSVAATKDNNGHIAGAGIYITHLHN